MKPADTLGELANEATRLYGERPCLGFQGRWETFAQTQVAIDRTALGLMEAGVQPGENVAVWMTNRPEWIHVMYALAKIGAVMVPVNTRFRTSDLDYVLRQSDSATLVTMDQSGPIGYLDMVLELCPEIDSAPPGEWRAPAFPELRRVISLGDQTARGVISWPGLLSLGRRRTYEELREREAAVRPDDPLFIMYTSGTTGFPKGVVQTHSVIRNIRFNASTLKMTPDDHTVMFLPLFHAFGYFQGALMTHATGARMTLMETFDPGEALAVIESEKGTVIHGFDTHWQDLLDHPSRPSRDLSSLRTGILAAGLPSCVKVAERAYQELCPTSTGYGMTEIMPGALMGFTGDTLEHSSLTSGRPSEGMEFKVIDPETGRVLGDNEPGEMCVRGYAVMRGYYKKPEETAKTIDAEGWLHTGDMGVRLPDGYYRMLGRFKEMLKVGGENVDPVEVESYFLGHPAVARIQVVAVPDRRLEEIPVAFAVLKPGASATEADLAAFAKGKIASFKIPRRFFFVPEYPMTPSGKVKRFELRKLAEAELAEGD